VKLKILFIIPHQTPRLYACPCTPIHNATYNTK